MSHAAIAVPETLPNYVDLGAQGLNPTFRGEVWLEVDEWCQANLSGP